MSPTALVDGLAGFATLHPLFTFGPVLLAALLLRALARRAHAIVTRRPLR